LDMDGVLVPFNAQGVVPGLLGQLKRIHDTTGCKVVLSSAWRIFKSSVALVNQHLQSAEIHPLIGETPQLGVERSQEVITWMETHEENRQVQLKRLLVTSQETGLSAELLELTLTEIEEINGEEITHWVAVDDMNLSMYNSKSGYSMRGHFVHTDSNVGLVADRADLAIRILTDTLTEEDHVLDRKLHADVHAEFEAKEKL